MIAGFPTCNSVAIRLDLDTEEWKELFRLLEHAQSEFLMHQERFRSREYKWPLDPLHTWSRVWEYPYVYAHLLDRREACGREGFEHVVDLGCGVTFFPFAVAKLGTWVTGTDIDPVCRKDLAAAEQFLKVHPGRVDFSLADGKTLPFEDGSIDVVYCISVLEHIPDFPRTIAEVERILKPGGLFIVTIDLDLRGDAQIGVEPHRRLKEILAEDFDHVYPERSVHPADILTTRRSPFPLQGYPFGLRSSWLILRRLAFPLFGRRPLPFSPPVLAVEGMVLAKRIASETKGSAFPSE